MDSVNFHLRQKGKRRSSSRFTVLVVSCALLCGLEYLLFGFLYPAHATEIAILQSANITAYNKALSTFKAGLPKSVSTITEFNMEGDMARGRKFARKLRASNALLVLAIGLKAALAAKLEILDIPVIFCMVLNPKKYALSSPNMTGIELKIPAHRQLKIIQLILPTVNRIGVVFDPTKTGMLIEEARYHIKKLRMTLVAKAVSSEKEVPITLRALVPGVDALWLLPDSTVLNEESLDFFLGTTLEGNIPLFGFSSGLVRSGALASFYIKYEDVGEQAAILATKILQGSIIPVGMVAPLDKVRISLNLKTAKFLHISIPPDVMSQADDIF